MPPAADEAQVVSPDGSVELRVAPRDGQLRFAVAFKNRPVVESSPLAISVGGANLCECAELGTPEAYQVDERLSLARRIRRGGEPLQQP